MKLGIVDNYDSFTYNLVHYMEDIIGEKPHVWLNDQLNWAELDSCTHLILSPGPGLPATSGSLMEVIRRFHGNKHMLGVCLGMQAIGLYMGSILTNLKKVHHGEQSTIKIIGDHDGLYHGLPEKIQVGRYHSWVVDSKELTSDMQITSIDENNELMSFKHIQLPIYGVQYHPESIMTPHGKEILQNWINRC